MMHFFNKKLDAAPLLIQRIQKIDCANDHEIETQRIWTRRRYLFTTGTFLC